MMIGKQLSVIHNDEDDDACSAISYPPIEFGI